MGSMKDQLEGLYNPGAYARAADPVTSKRAAASVKVNPLETAVLDALAKFGPMNTHQIVNRTGIDAWSISPRMKPLERKGKIVRQKVEGERQIVWRLA